MTNLAQFDKAIAQQLLDSSETFPIEFNVAWKWLGYNHKHLAAIDLLSSLVEGTDYITLSTTIKRIGGSITTNFFMLSLDGFKKLARISKTELGKLVQIYFLEAESLAHLKKEKEITESLAHLKKKKEIQSQKLAKIEFLIRQHYSEIDSIYQSRQEAFMRIWRKIIDHLEPLTTRELLKHQCTLIEFDGESARIGISSENLLKLVQGKLTNLQAAFTTTFQRQIKVTLEVAPIGLKKITFLPLYLLL